jgi:hypothetical protein
VLPSENPTVVSRLPSQRYVLYTSWTIADHSKITWTHTVAVFPTHDHHRNWQGIEETQNWLSVYPWHFRIFIILSICRCSDILDRGKTYTSLKRSKYMNLMHL